MIPIFINALAASAGGGLTYVRNLLPQLAMRDDVAATVLAGPHLRQELRDFSNINFLECENCSSSARRFWFEQSRLPRLIKHSGANVLLSLGNFALRNSPVPQILLSRNSLYTSTDFSRDLLARRHYGILIDTKMKAAFAKRSLTWADCTVAPTAAFARDLELWSGRSVIPIHHGFDKDAFFRGGVHLAPQIQKHLDTASDSLRLLFVSHYNYYRNFETLLRAVPLIREKIAPRTLKLFLTCQLRAGMNPGAYRAESAESLVRNLGIRDCVIELGNIPYRALHFLYRASHIYVTAAYTETFAHPLVEAMACGIPVVASDLPVHREICGSAALYFDRFSHLEMAERITHLSNNPGLHQELKNAGIKRSACFSWEGHTAAILDLARSLVCKRKAQAA